MVEDSIGEFLDPASASLLKHMFDHAPEVRRICLRNCRSIAWYWRRLESERACLLRERGSGGIQRDYIINIRQLRDNTMLKCETTSIRGADALKIDNVVPF